MPEIENVDYLNLLEIEWFWAKFGLRGPTNPAYNGAEKFLHFQISATILNFAGKMLIISKTFRQILDPLGVNRPRI